MLFFHEFANTVARVFATTEFFAAVATAFAKTLIFAYEAIEVAQDIGGNFGVGKAHAVARFFGATASAVARSLRVFVFTEKIEFHNLFLLF